MLRFPTVADVAAALDRLAPTSRAAEWDHVGLQLGDPSRAVASAAVCHEVTDAVVGAVERRPVDLLVTYHPVLFHPTTSLVAGPSPQGRVLRLAEVKTAVLAAHTNFDVAPSGAADALAAALGLDEVRSFGAVHPAAGHKLVVFVPEPAAARVSRAMMDAGAGRIGGYRDCSFRVEGTGTFRAPPGAAPAVGEPGEHTETPELRIETNVAAGALDAVLAAAVDAHPYQEPAFDVLDRVGDVGFVGRVGVLGSPQTLVSLARDAGERLGGVVRFAGDPQREVRRVAAVPGSGGSLVAEAASAGADVLVTGDVSHHRAREAVDRGIGVVDPGHAATERPGIRRLYAAVSEIVRTVEDLDMDPDPWRGP